MIDIEQLLSDKLLRRFNGGRITDVEASDVPLVVHASRNLSIEVDTQLPVRLVIMHAKSNISMVDIKLCAGAQLSLTDIYTLGCYTSTSVHHDEGSACRIVSVVLAGAHIEYKTLFEAPHAESDIYATFIASGTDRCSVAVVTRHDVPDCRSNSLVKGVAAGSATGEFHGLVYVAQGAQRTDAAQLSRNVELGQAHIVTQPQLEIYADDVKCSHGTTVGKLDEEALYYMQQRGIARRDAERLQLEGFVNDVVSKCDVVSVAIPLEADVFNRLEQL